MVSPDSTGLLRLLGHELRGPAGIIGGSLTVLERHGLEPEQERAVVLARRAQQQMIDILDDIRRLVEARRSELPAARGYPLAGMLERTAEACDQIAVELEVSIHPDADFSVTVNAELLVQALTTFALTVAREHAVPVVCDVTREGPGRAHAFALLSFLPRGRNFRVDPTRTQFHELRPGLGFRLVVACEYIRRLGGEAWDLVSGDKPAGLEVRLPLAY
jgi:hypothetical protein